MMSGSSPRSERSSVENILIIDRRTDPTPAYRIAVVGMMCQESCGSTIEAAIKSVKGVSKVIVCFSDKEAKVWGDAAVSLVIDAVDSVGFDAALIVDKPSRFSDQKRPEVVLPVHQTKVETRKGGQFTKTEAAKALQPSVIGNHLFTVLDVIIIGMSNSNCVRSIESGLKTCVGIQAVRVALIAEEAEIVFDSSILTPGQILDKIVIMGYSASVVKRRKLGKSKRHANETLNLVELLLLTPSANAYPINEFLFRQFKFNQLVLYLEVAYYPGTLS